MRKVPFKTAGALIGAAAGLLLLHPYVMAVLSLAPGMHQNHVTPPGLRSFLALIFSPSMLPMTAAFVIFASVMGLLAGMVVERERRLEKFRQERERQKAVMEAVHRLIMVLSHHIINSALAIGAGAKALSRAGSNEERGQALKEIEGRIERIEAVMRTMQEMEFQEVLHGQENGYEGVIRTSRWIEERMGGGKLTGPEGS